MIRLDGRNRQTEKYESNTGVQRSTDTNEVRNTDTNEVRDADLSFRPSHSRCSSVILLQELTSEEESHLYF